jgi:hypothetical protein
MIADGSPAAIARDPANALTEGCQLSVRMRNKRRQAFTAQGNCTEP